MQENWLIQQMQVMFKTRNTSIFGHLGAHIR